MKVIAKIEKVFDAKILSVHANVRYWEDATINGVPDEDGELTPCKNGDFWCPEIDIETGQIANWPKGVKAEIHFKVCDEGVYILKDTDGNVIHTIEGYVPSCMAPKETGYGDYIIMNVNDDGLIDKWSFNPENFLSN